MPSAGVRFAGETAFLILVALGALLFAGEFWRLRVYLNRILEGLGLSG